MTRFAVTFVCALLAGCASLVAPRVVTQPEALRSGGYSLDPAHASVIFKINHLGFSTYIGRFNELDASLDFDEANPQVAQLEAIVNVASLDIANDDFAKTLTGPDWFNAGEFPQAVFRTSKVTLTGETTGVLDGDLSLKGVTAPITLDVTFNGGGSDLFRGGYVVGFSARGTFDRTVFGVDKFAGLVGNDVAIEIEAEFIRNGD